MITCVLLLQRDWSAFQSGLQLYRKIKKKRLKQHAWVGQRSTSEIPGGSLQSTAMSGTKEVNAPQKLLQYQKGYVRLTPNSPFPNAQGLLGPADGPLPSGGANS